MAASGSEEERWPRAGETPFIQAPRKGSLPAASLGLGEVRFCNFSLKLGVSHRCSNRTPYPGSRSCSPTELLPRAPAEHWEAAGGAQSHSPGKSLNRTLLVLSPPLKNLTRFDTDMYNHKIKDFSVNYDEWLSVYPWRVAGQRTLAPLQG